jgi:hypothetical protein
MTEVVRLIVSWYDDDVFGWMIVSCSGFRLSFLTTLVGFFIALSQVE